jgi:hypothetical protein
MPLAIAAAALSAVATPDAWSANDTALRLRNDGGANAAYVRVPNHADFALQTLTVEAWVRRFGNGYGFTEDPSGAGIVARPAENASGSYIASWHFNWTNSGQVLFNLVHTYGTNGVYLTSPAVATPLARHHIAATFDGATVRIVVDGVETASAPWSLGTVNVGNYDLLIGAENFALGYLRRFDGEIDDVRLWNYARTPQQIAATMNCRLTGAEPGLVAYWTFDGSNLLDQTGHGHDGTIQATAGALTYESLATLGACTVGIGDSPAAGGAGLALFVFPQPAQGAFRARFELGEAGPVALDAYDVAGRLVARLAGGDYPAGRHELAIDAAALGVRHRGVVFLRLSVGAQTVTRPLVIAGN